MKYLIALSLVALTGCAGLSTWVTANQVAIGQVALVAGAVAAVENVTVDTVQLEKDLQATQPQADASAPK
jgi:hypothetical protein